MNEIVIFESSNGEIQVQLEQETVWLSLDQMTQLFGRDKSVISRHIRNIFKDEELIRSAVVAKNATTARDGKMYQVESFNLDVIISVGYRVKSQQGVRFRQWATKLLKQHLTQGYTLNQQRFEENAQELEAALKLIKKAALSPELSSDTGKGLVEIVSRYTQTFLWLQRYDEGLLNEPSGKAGVRVPTFAKAHFGHPSPSSRQKLNGTDYNLRCPDSSCVHHDFVQLSYACCAHHDCLKWLYGS